MSNPEYRVKSDEEALELARYWVKVLDFTDTDIDMLDLCIDVEKMSRFIIEKEDDVS